MRPGQPIVRVVFDSDDPANQIGIYEDAGLLRLVWYDHQGQPGEFPRQAAGALGRALLALSDRQTGVPEAGPCAYQRAEWDVRVIGSVERLEDLPEAAENGDGILVNVADPLSAGLWVWEHDGFVRRLSPDALSGGADG